MSPLLIRLNTGSPGLPLGELDGQIIQQWLDGGCDSVYAFILGCDGAKWHERPWGHFGSRGIEKNRLPPFWWDGEGGRGRHFEGRELSVNLCWATIWAFGQPGSPERPVGDHLSRRQTAVVLRGRLPVKRGQGHLAGASQANPF